MKKYDDFLSALQVMKKAEFERADQDEIYRTGIVGQFNLMFELAWKALQAVLRMHAVAGAENGSPRETMNCWY